MSQYFIKYQLAAAIFGFRTHQPVSPEVSEPPKPDRFPRGVGGNPCLYVVEGGGEATKHSLKELTVM